MTLSREKIVEHYKKNWSDQNPNIKIWEKGPMQKLKPDFCILEFPPYDSREMWTYATCGMSSLDSGQPIEIHLFSSRRDDNLVELLTLVAYYHNTSDGLYLWHTVDLGKPWQDDSICSHGLISLPYLDGPDLENLYIPEVDENLKFLWFIPITEEEVRYKVKNGVEALEEKFEEGELDYLNPNRKSVIVNRKGFFS